VTATLFFLLITVLCVSAANLFLRYGMARLGRGGFVAVIRHAIKTPWVLMGGFLYAISMVAWLATLRDMQLGLAYPVYFGGSFALVLLGSVFLLGEELTWQRLVGVAAIFAGILLATP